MKPVISIIIIVKNDWGIANTLDALTYQKSSLPNEIIVVDASRVGLFESLRKKYPEVRWFNFAPSVIKNKASIPEQRNMGIKNALGDIIVFIDANCVPSENWLINLTEPIIQGRETMTAGSVKAFSPHTHVNLNSADKKGDYLTSSPTINLAFKKSVWESVGGFDESFSFGSDVDFTWRSIEKGNRIRFVREAVVTHDWGNFKDEVKRAFKYGMAKAQLLKKHPKQRWKITGDNTVPIIYGAWMLGLPLTFIFWWYPLTIIIPIIKNIRQKPFKTTFLNLIYALGFYKKVILILLHK
ncbi:MAG TPA: glycosyltransferase [Candidatus Paceibacterota bacterium]|nr:glycosyltransferase [Candidatus Paceibacterota bacterium]